MVAVFERVERLESMSLEALYHNVALFEYLLTQGVIEKKGLHFLYPLVEYGVCRCFQRSIIAKLEAPCHAAHDQVIHSSPPANSGDGSGGAASASLKKSLEQLSRMKSGIAFMKDTQVMMDYCNDYYSRFLSDQLRQHAWVSVHSEAASYYCLSTPVREESRERESTVGGISIYRVSQYLLSCTRLLLTAKEATNGFSCVCPHG